MHHPDLPDLNLPISVPVREDAPIEKSGAVIGMQPTLSIILSFITISCLLATIYFNHQTLMLLQKQRELLDQRLKVTDQRLKVAEEIHATKLRTIHP